ncbi:AMP-binding protein [Streptomyces sp. PTM05]|uniref:AMP-binding protein n=1 Tax=Streptantibioticus parmotrematis TaxID=2873249 RepID=A0ABS7QUV1_9ACTN|nr:amino acid adenylation domain-containing protein [Streptantibioticus parmotrematis]MBY8886988.1 AMP-binding protein [Streptantibioticus parmotrematis]
MNLASPAPSTSATPLVDLVRAAADRRPRAIAVEQAGHQVTYRQLTEAVDQLALRLRESGAGTVAVTGERGIPLVVAVIAVLAAPAKLVTVDPQLPASRRAAMLDRAGVDLVLATEAYARYADPEGKLPVHNIPQMGEEAGLLSVVRPGGPPKKAGGYVFFTSGTTGSPKAIAGRQLSVAHFVSWQRDAFDIASGDRFAQVTGLSFDVFLRDLFTPLVSGATVCLPSGLATGWQGLLDWLRHEDITVVHTVPSLAARWLATDVSFEAADRLRLTFFAGEPLSARVVSQWREHFPGSRVVNLYGPTETTLAKFWHEVDTPPVPGSQPVGRPLPDTELRLVDDEVWIRTPYRTDGYVDDPAETARRFVHSDAEPDGHPWYRTGDLGSLDERGLLRLRGRSDLQIKINGNRIEPEGVTAQLRCHPLVRDAVVTARRRPDGALYLAAHYVAGTPTGLSPVVLRSWLADRLPAAHVPSVLVPMDTLPLGANGKVDRTALPDPLAGEPAEVCDPQVGPDPLHDLVAASFEAVLRCPRGAVDADFFEYGGTSLDAADLSIRLLRSTGRQLEMHEIYELRTARHVTERLRSRPMKEQPPIPHGLQLAVTGLAPQQQRYRRVFLPFGNRSWANMPALIVLPDHTEADAVREALTEIVKRHDSLRAWFEEDSAGEVRQYFAEEIDIRVATVELETFPIHQHDAHVERLWISEANTLLPDTRPPLFRACLVRHGLGRSTLLWNVHHMVSDGFSQQLFRQELSALLNGAAASDLPGLPISYRDYIAWCATGGSGTLSAQRAYWQQVFSEPYDRVLLPTRHACAEPARGIAYQFPIEEKLNARAERFARDHGLTVFSVFLAAYFLLAHSLYGTDDLVVVTPAAGRTRPEVQNLIGNFISLVAIRHRAGEETSFADLAGLLQRRAIRAMENQDYQYDQVMADVGAAPDDDRFPLTTVCISLMDLPPEQEEQLQLPRCRDLGCDVKFDLLGYLRHAGGTTAFDLHSRRSLMDEEDLRDLKARFVQILDTHLPHA